MQKLYHEKVTASQSFFFPFLSFFSFFKLAVHKPQIFAYSLHRYDRDTPYFEAKWTKTMRVQHWKKGQTVLPETKLTRKTTHHKLLVKPCTVCLLLIWLDFNFLTTYKACSITHVVVFSYKLDRWFSVLQ